jgi:hypothetical protein
MLSINLSINVSKDLLSKLDGKTYTNVLIKSVRDTANYAENQLGINLQKMVYSDKIGNKYIFTGRLLRGRKSRQIDPLEIQINSNPVIAGAKRDYAKFVNEGTKFMKARPYFDKTVIDTQKQSQKILQENLKSING